MNVDTPNIHGFVTGFAGQQRYMLPVWLPNNASADEPFGPQLQDALDAIAELEYERAECEAEMHAESAWLRAAENSTPQHELDYELEREAQDAGLQYLRSQEGA